jgi:hypothetical protein
MSIMTMIKVKSSAHRCTKKIVMPSSFFQFVADKNINQLVESEREQRRFGWVRFTNHPIAFEHILSLFIIIVAVCARNQEF